MKLSSSFLSKAFAALLVSTAANTVNATAFQVTNTNDSGAGSLRQAITDSNAPDSSADTITFGVTGTITLNSGLPAITSSGGTLTLTGPGATLLTINGNQGNFSIFSVASGGNLSVSGLTVSGAKHDSGSGGAFRNFHGTLSISNSTLSNNSSVDGGAIWSRGPLSVSNSSFANNSAPSSGAIYIFGVSTISNSSFTNNFAGGSGGGGAIKVLLGLPSLNGNPSEPSTLIISNSTFSGNSIQGGEGSAIFNYGETIISNTTIFGNTGGVAIANGGTLNVSNCTISGNKQRADYADFGAGIFNYDRNDVTLILKNTIIANSVVGTDFEGKAPTTNTNNLVETIGYIDSGTFTPSITADPKLGPLQNNGGFTKTMALLPGSPAIGTGDSSISTANPINGLDQRGFVRNASDIGAYSYNFAPTGNIVVSKSSDNQLVLSLASGGVTLSDLHTQYSGNALTITTTGAGAITTVPNTGIGGITPSGNSSVTADLTFFQGFSGLTVVGNSNSDNIIVPSPGIDLTTVSGGSANQSVTVHSFGTSQFSLNAAAKPKGNGGLTLGAGTLSVNLTDITTTGGDQSYTGGMIVNNSPGLTLSAGGGAINLEATTNSQSASHPHYDLTVQTTGDVAISGAVGANEALGNFRIEGNDISLGNIGTVSTVGLTGNSSLSTADAGSDHGSINLTGTYYLTTGQQFYNSSSGLSAFDGTNPIRFGGDSLSPPTTVALKTAGNGINNALEFTGLVDLNGRIVSIDTTNTGAVGGDITFNQTVNGPGNLSMNAGSAGSISTTGNLGAIAALNDVSITNAGAATFVGSLSTADLHVSDITDSHLINFVGNVTATNSMTIAAGGPYNLQMLGAVNTIAGATTFANAGSVSLGDAGTDSFNFTGGIVATSPSSINLAGTIGAAGTGIITLGDSNTALNIIGSSIVGGTSSGAISLGNVLLSSGTSLTAGTGIANAITLGAVTGTSGNALILNTTGGASVTGTVGSGINSVTVTNSGGTSFQNALSAETLSITNTTGTVALQGNLSLGTSLVTYPQPYNVSITGSNNTIAGATTFLNTGTVTLGNGNSDISTFNNGLIATAPASITTQGTIATTNANMTLGDANTGITNNGTFSFPAILNSGTGHISLAGNVTGNGSNNPIKVVSSGVGSTTISGVNTAEAQMSSGLLTMAQSAVQTGGYRISGGTLRGGSREGKVGYIYTQGGSSILAPGIDAPGMMHSNFLSLDSGNTVQIDLQGYLDTQYDHFEICSSGTLALNNASLNLSATFIPTVGSVFRIMDNVDPSAVIGTFAGLPEGTKISSGGNYFQISYVGGTGNDVTLTAVVGPPANEAINAGNNQTAIAGNPVPLAPSVIVKDANNNPVSGVFVSFSVESGNGSVTGASTATNAQGIATVGSWTLGTTSGLNTLKASAIGIIPAIFTANGTAGAAATIVMNSGDNQSATAGTAVSVAPSVLVTDTHSNPVSGTSVTFAVATGGGSLSGSSTVTTNGNGIATAPTWTLGTTAGSNTLTATSGSLSGSPVTYTATGTAGTAATIALNAGNNQSATVGTAVSVAPSVLVTDTHSNPVSGTSVTFAVATGGGSLSGSSTVTTNGNGIATAPTWTLGTTAGSNTLTATSGSLSGSPVTYTATGLSNQSSGDTPGGRVTTNINGGGFVPGTTQFTTATNPPAGKTFPYGVFDFTAQTTPGGTVTVTITYPQPLPAGTQYLKSINGAWVDWTSRVSVSGSTVTLPLTDGQYGDTNPASGLITDPFGPAVSSVTPSPSPIPTLSQWAEIMMMFMMILTVGWYGRRLKQR